MILDKISHNALETLLGMTFGNNTKHYSIVSEQGLDYPLIKDIELNYNTGIKETYSPFSTFVSKSILKNYLIDQIDLVSEGMKEVKKLSIFHIFSKLNSKKEELKIKIELSQKCISDELVKSQKILENKDLDNTAILLLLKGIKNLENPEFITGLKPSEIQEVGALQIGMAINALNRTTPKLFQYSKNDMDDFSYFIGNIKENKFIQECCRNASLKEKSIVELYVAANKDKQYDAFINSNNEIDYSSSLSDLSGRDKNKKIGEIKRDARTLLNGKKYDI
jgi:hypothetical protein